LLGRIAAVSLHNQARVTGTNNIDACCPPPAKSNVDRGSASWTSGSFYTGESLYRIWRWHRLTRYLLALRQLIALLNPKVLVVRNDSGKHAHHAAMKESGGGDGETHFTVAVVSETFADKASEIR